MINRRNYYRILHVQPDAPREIIKASYRTLMQKLRQHPDLGGDNWNASILNEAYAILTNKNKRTAYDQQFLHKHKKIHRQTGKRENGGHNKKQRKYASTNPHGKDDRTCLFCGTAKPVLFQYSNSGDCNYCHSPLKPVVRLRLAGKPKRSLHRTLLREPIHYYFHQDEIKGKTGVTRDLSPNGMQFITTNHLEENQLIKIVCSVLSAVARVTYCRPYNGRKEYAVGVEFLSLKFHTHTGTFFSENA